jgi:hypothetical protein
MKLNYYSEIKVTTIFVYSNIVAVFFINNSELLFFH